MTAKPLNIVLTGAARGLGQALTGGFVAAGHVVYGCGRAAAGAAMERLFTAPGRFDRVDVTDDEAVRRWAGEVLAAAGPPDLLINNAALMNRSAPLWELTAGEFDELLDVNVKGVANVLRHYVPAMVARRRGVIVNLSSGRGRAASPGIAPYCASKFAVEGLTLSLAQELPAGLAAVPLNPGIIDTDMLRSSFGEEAANYPTPETWARRAVPYLLGLSAADNGRSLSVPA